MQKAGSEKAPEPEHDELGELRDSKRFAMPFVIVIVVNIVCLTMQYIQMSQSLILLASQMLLQLSLPVLITYTLNLYYQYRDILMMETRKDNKHKLMLFVKGQLLSRCNLYASWYTQIFVRKLTNNAE